MENTTKGLVAAGVAKAKAQLVEDDSEVESDGSGELLDSGEVSAEDESSEEDAPPPPPVARRRPQPRAPRQPSRPGAKLSQREFLKQKRKKEALKEFHKFSKKMKLDTGLSIKTIAGGDIVEIDELLSDYTDDSYTRRDESDSSDGFSDPDFTIDPAAGLAPDPGNESFIDPETGDIVVPGQDRLQADPHSSIGLLSDKLDNDMVDSDVNKTLSISDIICDDNELDLSKNVDIEEILGGNEFTISKTNSMLSDSKPSEVLGADVGDDAEYDITEKLKEMGEISVKAVPKDGSEEPLADSSKDGEAVDGEDEKNKANALNVRRNIREVMDEKQLDASTLAAQRQESERLARVQEQQRLIREVRRQIALGRQDKAQARVVSLLQGGASVLRKPDNKLNLPGTVLVKLPSGEIKKTALKPGQLELLKVQRSKGNLTPSVSIAPVNKMEPKPGTAIKKEVVEIVDSSSSSSSSESPSSDSDDCIMLSDSELPPSPEPEEDPQNSGLHVNDTYNIPDDQGRVVINIGHPENEEDIFLAPQIGRIIKPHQIGGVRFLFDNIIESVERFSTSTGFGCILAHSMGLGKTLQIVCFCDIFLRHTSSKTVLCIMPINTLQNWVAEFNMWLPLDPAVSPLNLHGEVRPRNFPIYVLNDSHKTLQARAKVIKDWTTQGGVLMIGYELYRLLSMKKNKKPRSRKKKNDPPTPPPIEKFGKKSKAKDSLDSKDMTDADKLEAAKKMDGIDFKKNDFGDGIMKHEGEGEGNKDGEASKDLDKKEEEDETDEELKLLNEMHAALVKPGPDLVICDEGHRIKNSHSNISFALKQMRTKRRVVLTGYPLQNNLLEYWCMVDFVRPNYLGTKTEFSNMFERPIQNGQCIDSTPQDIRLMRYRAHVLHSLLVGFVQRRSHAVLQTTLPQKEEYVLLVRMTDLQRKLYDTFMNEVVRKKTVPNPLKAFAVCCKIWNHPDVLYYFLKKRDEMAALIDYDLELGDPSYPGTMGANNPNNPINKRGKNKSRGTSNRRKDKVPFATHSGNGKPAATIPPNTSNHNAVDSYGSYDPNKPPVHNPNGPHYGYGGEMGHNVSGYPPYQGYHQYPPQSNNYYGQSDSYGQPYNSGYYNQPYSGDYNHYNSSNSQAPPDGNMPAPQQNASAYPQHHGYNPQSYWGGENNYYNNSNPGYYPNQNQPNYQSNQDPYSNMYDPYAQQTQPFHGFNQNRPYDRNVPNGEQIQQGFDSSNPSYQPPNPATGPPVPFATTPSAVPTDTNSYNTNLYPPFPNVRPAPVSQDVKTEPGAAAIRPWPLGAEDNANKAGPLAEMIKSEIKAELKPDSDGEIKIEDLDTKKVIHDTKLEIKGDTEKTEPLKDINDIKLGGESKVNEENMDKKDDPVSEANNDKNKFTDKKNKDKDEKNKSKKLKEKIKGKDKDKKSKNKNSKDKKGKEDDSDDSEKEEDKKDESDSKKVEIKEEVPYEWANDLLKAYIPGIIENSAKMEILFCILEESIRLGDRILLFSQSLFTLNLIEDFLHRNYIPGTEYLWAKNRSYYRLDGSTSALEREKLINEFNLNPNIHLFLVSTRAGSLGINLVGANRVIVFDASWNPCHDTQAVCRVYRYGQKKPCFVYRLVMDCCLEKKIYDRQINKQGMADRVVDECNPDAVLSMKEVTNLCWDNDEKEEDIKEFQKDCKEKYLDVIMRKIIEEHARTLSKEPFQHESLLVDRKEKKLSSAEKRLAQRGYELEKKAASNPKPSLMYRTIRTADGSLIQRPVASVRPMQHGGSGARWIPAEVWQRQGMTAQEMTLPLDVVIPTNSAEKSNIVLKAGQKVMVLKSPKGIYMQLESGKIIAIKTSFKVGNKNPDGTTKEGGGTQVIKKILPNRPGAVSLPGSLKNNSAITVISKSSRGGIQKVMTRPNLIQNKMGGAIRPFLPGQRVHDIKVRGLNSAMQARPFSLIRGRGGNSRPARPIPIQNKLNIKIQGANLNNSATISSESKEIEKDETEMESDPNIDTANSNNSNQCSESENQPPKMDTENVEHNPEQSQEQNTDSSDAFEPGVTSTKALKPTVPEDIISEDSSQEKTYVDLSDKCESKITTKPNVKKSPMISPRSGGTLTECKIPIKNSISQAIPIDIGFMNEVTIKRTPVIAPAPSPPASESLTVSSLLSEAPRPSPINLLTDETFPTEASLTEHRLPAAQNSVFPLIDDSSLCDDDDIIFKEKKIYKPNLVDRRAKTNSLKNYRHQKLMQKNIPIHSSDFMGKSSPASTSSTPTPPPVAGYATTSPHIPKVPQEKFESSLSQLEKTASSINRNPKGGGISDFQQSLSDITRNYSPNPSEPTPPEQSAYKPGPKSRKKKSVPEETDLPAAIVTDSSSKLGVIPAMEPSLIQNLHPGVSSLPSTQPSFGHPGYGVAPDPSGLTSGFNDPIYQQQNPIAADTIPTPQQPYNAYPGYPSGSAAYSAYAAPPYYQGYAGAGYPGYPPYAAPPAFPPGYPPAPYPAYPPYPNPNHQW